MANDQLLAVILGLMDDLSQYAHVKAPKTYSTPANEPNFSDFFLSAPF